VRLLNLEFLHRAAAHLPTKVVKHLEKTRPAHALPAHARILKVRSDNIHNVNYFGRACNISPKTICRELLHYIQLTLSCERLLPEIMAILTTLTVEPLTQLEILVLGFQKAGVYEIHRARWTGTRHFHNQTSRNDCVWIQGGCEHMDGALRGHLQARLIAQLKIRWGYRQQDMVCRLTRVQFMSVVDTRHSRTFKDW